MAFYGKPVFNTLIFLFVQLALRIITVSLMCKGQDPDRKEWLSCKCENLDKVIL